MVRMILGYEENRGARHVVLLLALALIVCLSGIVASGLVRPHPSSDEVKSPITINLGRVENGDMTWFATSDEADSGQNSLHGTSESESSASTGQSSGRSD